MKAGKTLGFDGTTAEILKCGGEAVVEWVLYLAWKQGKVAYCGTTVTNEVLRLSKEVVLSVGFGKRTPFDLYPSEGRVGNAGITHQ